jgi:phage tail-like protein
MALDFGEVLFRLLPGLYRDKDVSGELRRFLEIMASPLAEIDASITQLHEDQFIATCRPEFIGPLGSLIGAEIDATLPDHAQRAEAEHALDFYRTKGLRPTLERLAEEITGWRVSLVDFSPQVAQTAALDFPTATSPSTLHIGDPSAIERLGRMDDAALYTVDLRAPRHTSDRIGQKHFDNVGFFFAPTRIIVNQRPNVLPPGSEGGRFTFDSRALEPGDAIGVRLQLLDAFDGQPITRRKLQGHELDFCGTRRGFTIRVNDVSITDPEFEPPLFLKAANLEDFAKPKDAEGRPLALGDDDVAIDPELGRFRVDLEFLGTSAERVRVDYLLAAVDDRVLQAEPSPLTSEGPPEFFSFDSEGGPVRLRDAFDGTPLAVSMRLGVRAVDYHGTERGWQIFHNRKEVSASLEVQIADLPDDHQGPVAKDHIAVDPERGRFKFASEFIASDDHLEVSFSFESEAGRERVVQNLLQRLPRALPAGVVPVLIDVRKPAVDPAHLS